MLYDAKSIGREQWYVNKSVTKVLLVSERMMVRDSHSPASFVNKGRSLEIFGEILGHSDIRTKICSRSFRCNATGNGGLTACPLLVFLSEKNR